MKTHNASEHEALQNFISDGTPLAIRARYASLPEAAAQSDYGDLDRNIVVIDATLTDSAGNICTEATCTYFSFPREKAERDMHFVSCKVEGEE